MAVLFETSLGDLVIDLYTEECPQASLNFLKLCKLKYYNSCKFHSVQNEFIAQTGDPTGTGRGGDSVFKLLYGEQARFFEDEIRPSLRHVRPGLVGMAGAGKDMNASQFYITLGSNLDSLDDKHTLFGEVSEGLEILELIGKAFTDSAHKPLQNIRIKHTIALEDPFPDPPGLAELVPEASPEPVLSQGDEITGKGEGLTNEADSRAEEARSRAVVLEMIGDLPEADAAPPSNMLFVCKLNPVTDEEDLEIIFSRFGKMTSCDIIRDWKTGDSLCYAFLGYDNDKSAEEAFFKMNNVLIDDRRIKVDFSQSVFHLWKQFRNHGAKQAPHAAEYEKKNQPHPRAQDKQKPAREAQRPGRGDREGGTLNLDSQRRRSRSPQVGYHRRSRSPRSNPDKERDASHEHSRRERYNDRSSGKHQHIHQREPYRTGDRRHDGRRHGTQDRHTRDR